MKESAFNRKVIEICGDDHMAQYQFIKSFKKTILDAYEDEDNKWKLFNPNHKNDNIEPGVYLTLRCGYGGIYQIQNSWDAKAKDWMMKSADGSYTIMYKGIESYLNQ